MTVADRVALLTSKVGVAVSLDPVGLRFGEQPLGLGFPFVAVMGQDQSVRATLVVDSLCASGHKARFRIVIFVQLSTLGVPQASLASHKHFDIDVAPATAVSLIAVLYPVNVQRLG